MGLNESDPSAVKCREIGGPIRDATLTRCCFLSGNGGMSSTSPREARKTWTYLGFAVERFQRTRNAEFLSWEADNVEIRPLFSHLHDSDRLATAGRDANLRSINWIRRLNAGRKLSFTRRCF